MNRRLLLSFVVGALVAACSSSVAPPDGSDPAVQAEEARLAELLEVTDGFWPPQPRQCSVRLLGQDGATSYVWAHCEGSEIDADGQQERPAGSLPLRIDGNLVSEPRDGSLYGEDIREMFPTDLADAILDGDQRVFP